MSFNDFCKWQKEILEKKIDCKWIKGMKCVPMFYYEGCRRCWKNAVEEQDRNSEKNWKPSVIGE